MFEDAFNLRQKAYSQGYTAGVFGREISKADWEEEFRPAYLDGYEHGRQDRLTRGAPNDP